MSDGSAASSVELWGAGDRRVAIFVHDDRRAAFSDHWLHPSETRTAEQLREMLTAAGYAPIKAVPRSVVTLASGETLTTEPSAARALSSADRRADDALAGYAAGDTPGACSNPETCDDAFPGTVDPECPIHGWT